MPLGTGENSILTTPLIMGHQTGAEAPSPKCLDQIRSYGKLQFGAMDLVLRPSKVTQY